VKMAAKKLAYFGSDAFSARVLSQLLSIM
jgi:hypothetical protein